MPITKTPYRTFGYITIRTVYTGGEHVVDPCPENRLWTNLFTKGGFRNCVTDATSTPPNHSTEDTNPGSWYTPEDFQEFYGNLTFDTLDPTEIWCLCGENNNNWMPYVSKWELSSGQTTTLPVGTKLFFCSGSITINGTTYTDPVQIHAKNSAVSVVSNQNSYGINFL